MSNQTDHLSRKIADFGVSLEAAQIYLSLAKAGPQGIMQITRQAGVGRNVAYRLLAELEEAQLVSVTEKSFGKQYTARGIDAFEATANSHQVAADQMRSGLNDIAAGLQALTPEPQSKITHFKGPEGVKQVNWNLRKIKGKIRVYEQSHMHEYMDPRFADAVREIYMQIKPDSYDLTNKTEVIRPEAFDLDYWTTNCNYRYLDPEVLDIQYEMYIYNDVVTLLDYAEKGKEHCIEIHNARLAKMQKQIYDAVWSQAQEFTQIDPKTGERRL